MITKVKDFLYSKLTSKKFITACIISSLVCLSVFAVGAEGETNSVASAVTSATGIVSQMVDLITSNPFTTAFAGMGLAAGGLRLFKRAGKSSKI